MDPRLTALRALPAKAWTAMTIARAGGKTRRVKVYQDPAVKLSKYPGTAAADRRRRPGP